MKQKVKNTALLMDSSLLLTSMHHYIQISDIFMLQHHSQTLKRHFHNLLTCLVECTEKYKEWSNLSKWLVKKG